MVSRVSRKIIGSENEEIRGVAPSLLKSSKTIVYGVKKWKEVEDREGKLAEKRNSRKREKVNSSHLRSCCFRL